MRKSESKRNRFQMPTWRKVSNQHQKSAVKKVVKVVFFGCEALPQCQYLTVYQPRYDDYVDAPSTDAPETCDEGSSKSCATGGRHFILSRPALQ